MADESPEIARLERLARLATLGEISAEVAHELRNALQIVSANAYLARKADPTSPYLGKIERSARIAHGIVDDVMTLARGDRFDAEPAPLTAVLVAARELLTDADYEDDIGELHVAVHGGLCARLFHVLYDNAIRVASPARARIVTRAVARDGGGVTVEVSDDGPGVPEAVRETLFEPLVSARKGGSGLGLALAKRIAEAHGATIALVPGTGATFRIELP